MIRSVVEKPRMISLHRLHLERLECWGEPNAAGVRRRSSRTAMRSPRKLASSGAS